MNLPSHRRYALSIVIPVFNEEPLLPTLFAELEKAAEGLLKPYGPVEIVLCNDGSSDKSWDMIVTYCQNHPDYIGVNLSRNFGQQLALIAGLETARGDVVVSMDADLQDPLALIPEMLKSYYRGYEVVHATRLTRGKETLKKRLTAYLFYFLIERISGVPVLKNTGDFRLLSRRALTELSRLKETHLFLRGMVPWIGFPQTQVFYERAERVRGETHYPFWKMLRFAFDGIASMSIAPLRLAYIFSLLLFGVFVGYIFYVLYEHFIRGHSLVPGWTSIMSAITIFGTIQLVLFGLFGEYLGRIYEQSKNRPLFIIQDVVQAELKTIKSECNLLRTSDLSNSLPSLS
ncbi:MAG TPA: glycosyltransferase family 2 protein [Verrucomicrobiae bacterium]|nr:glycosyltransferase family 2 protein [Verrucomicrobiae bacterium]